MWTKKTLAFDRPYRIPDSGTPGGYDSRSVNTPLDDHESPPSYVTQFTYDYLGRMQQMIYPDGETLTYGYDKGGQVTTVTGVTAQGQTLQYVKAITYDDYGQRVFIHYGNDVTTSYTYDPDRRWLAHILTQNNSGRVFQDTSYSFDQVGDVLSVTNNGFAPPLLLACLVAPTVSDGLRSSSCTAPSTTSSASLNSLPRSTSIAESFSLDRPKILRRSRAS